jgi:hypothetical protein
VFSSTLDSSEEESWNKMVPPPGLDTKMVFLKPTYHGDEYGNMMEYGKMIGKPRSEKSIQKRSIYIYI